MQASTMQTSVWKKYIPYLIVAIVFTGIGFASKATADGSLPAYVGCKL